MKALKLALAIALTTGFAAGSFADDWTYANGQITDGYWTFNASGEADAIEVGEIISSDPAETVLDFSKGVADGGKIVSIGRAACCRYNGDAIAASQQMTELVIGTTITNIGPSAFRNIANLQRVTLPMTPLFIDDAAFMGNLNLTTVTPFLPENTELDSTVFYNCAKLTGDLVLCNKSQKKLVTNRSNREYGVFRYTAITSVDMGDSVLEDIAFSCFRDCSQLKTVILPATLKSIGMDPAPEAGASFYNCVNLQQVVFKSFPSDHFPQDTFGPNGASWARRICFPAGDPEWEGFVNANPTLVKWDVAPQQNYPYDDKNAYPPVGYVTQLFPGTASGCVQMWFATYEAGVSEEISLLVTATPVETGVTDPTYGTYLDVGPQLPTNCVVSQYGQDERHYYESTGYRIGKSDAGVMKYGEFVPGRTVQFDAAEGGNYAVCWEWAAIGHWLTVQDATSPYGTVKVEGDEVAEGYYRTNTTVTLTVESDFFRRWIGDVPAGQETASTLVLTMDAAKTVRPIYEAPWTYANGQITDGYWTFNASGEADAIVVGEIISSDPAVTVLDFSRPVVGGRIVSMADGVCCKVATGQTLMPATIMTELILGEAVTNIGASAFRGLVQLAHVHLPQGLKFIADAAFMSNGNLTTVTPFLPPDTVIDSTVFYSSGRSALTGTLVLSSPRQTELKPNGAWGIFYDARISSADLTKTRIATIGESIFQGATLGDLFFPKTLKQIDQHAFSDCAHLTNIVFRSFPTTLDWNAVFGHSVSERIVPAYRRRIAYPAGNAAWETQVAAWSTSGDLTPWGGLDAEVQAQYRANYGKRSTPVGYLGESVLGADNAAWLVPLPSAGTMIFIQ